MPNLLTFLDLIDINRIAFVHGANFRRGVANDTEPRLCFAQKHSLRGELALFYRRNRGGEGGEKLSWLETRPTHAVRRSRAMSLLPEAAPKSLPWTACTQTFWISRLRRTQPPVGATAPGSSTGSLFLDGRGLCDPETRRTTRSAKGVRPPTRMCPLRGPRAGSTPVTSTEMAQWRVISPSRARAL